MGGIGNKRGHDHERSNGCQLLSHTRTITSTVGVSHGEHLRVLRSNVRNIVTLSPKHTLSFVLFLRLEWLLVAWRMP